LPARSPNLNAFAERFVRSIKSECLARIIPLSEQHLRRVIREYVEHYHLERNHQGLGNALIEELPAQRELAGGQGPQKGTAGWAAQLLPSGGGVICR
jgi:transposase InsO family protein